MAGGQGGAKKLRRSIPSVASGETRKESSKSGEKSKKKKEKKEEKKDKEEKEELVVGAGVGAGVGGVAETLEMAVDEATSSTITRQIRKQKLSSGSTGAVVYLGHIPHGFYEEQMKGFFSQFGVVNRIHLARNRKTGNSKHYAFIEFAHKEVANIVAKAMNGYLMFSKILVCQVVPPDEVHPNTFKNSDKPFRKIDWVAVERERHNQKRSAEEEESHRKKLLKKESRKRRKITEAGIDYDFPGVKAAIAKQDAKRQARGKA